MGGEEITKIDVCHAELIHGLVVAQKPKRILEMGYGGGRSSERILSALFKNENPCFYTLVDNWNDWGGVSPFQPEVPVFFKCPNVTVNIIEVAEEKFVKTVDVDPFDFIMSDADHNHAHEWFDLVYEKKLAPGGILIYHDVGYGYPGLGKIPIWCKERGIAYKVFKNSSRPDERCDRGLLVIFKGEVAWE